MDLIAAARVYRRVVECGSISAAAKSLELSQPTVSERIEKLEAYLGVRLLMRSARALSCTEEGQVFYTRSREIIDAAERTIKATLANRNQRAGLVRIASAQCFGELVLPRVLARLRESHPQLSLDVLLDDAVVDPISVGADISIRVGKPRQGNFTLHRLGHVPRRLVASAGYVERHGQPSTPQDLREHPFIRVKGVFSNERLQLTHAGRNTEAAISTFITTSHWRPMLELILNHSGIGVLQLPACAGPLAEGALVAVLPEYSLQPLPVNVLLQPSRSPTPRVDEVLERLKKEVPIILDSLGG